MTETTQPFNAVYTLGKLHSKYLILEFFGFAGTKMFAKEVLYSLSSCLRKLVVKNYKLLDFIITARTVVVVDNISQLLQYKILLNNTIHVGKIQILRDLVQVQKLLANKRIDLHSLQIIKIDSELLSEVGKIFKVKVLTIHISQLNTVDLSSFKFLENLIIFCQYQIMINNKQVIQIKHLVLNEIESIQNLQVLLTKFKPVTSLEIKLRKDSLDWLPLVNQLGIQQFKLRGCLSQIDLKQFEQLPIYQKSISSIDEFIGEIDTCSLNNIGENGQCPLKILINNNQQLMKASSHFKLFDNFQINIKYVLQNCKTTSIEIMSPFHGCFIEYCLECYPNLKSIIFLNRAKVINKNDIANLRNNTGLQYIRCDVFQSCELQFLHELTSKSIDTLQHLEIDIYQDDTTLQVLTSIKQSQQLKKLFISAINKQIVNIVSSFTNLKELNINNYLTVQFFEELLGSLQMLKVFSLKTKNISPIIECLLRNHHKLEEIKIEVGLIIADQFISSTQSNISNQAVKELSNAISYQSQTGAFRMTKHTPNIRGLQITGSCSRIDMIKIISSFPEVAFNFRNHINITTNWNDINAMTDQDAINAIYQTIKCIKSDDPFVRVYNKKGFRLTQQFESPKFQENLIRFITAYDSSLKIASVVGAKQKRINLFVNHDKKLLALGLCDYSVFKRWSGLESNNDLTFGELYEIHGKMLKKDIHGKMLKKDKLLLIKENVKNFLREYVDEFGREDTEKIIERISLLEQQEIDRIIFDYKNLTEYMNNL